MMWIVIVVSVLVAFVAQGYLRNSYLPRRRLEKFLSARGVEFVRVRSHPAYGWPGYVLAFESKAKGMAFRESPVFEALLDEVQVMHGDLKHGDNRFNARLAVSLEPTSVPDMASNKSMQRTRN